MPFPLPSQVVEASDVIIEVLDARDPLGCRCADVERFVRRTDPSKKIILLLNKIGERWIVPAHCCPRSFLHTAALALRCEVVAACAPAGCQQGRWARHCGPPGFHPVPFWDDSSKHPAAPHCRPNPMPCHPTPFLPPNPVSCRRLGAARGGGAVAQVFPGGAAGGGVQVVHTKAGGHSTAQQNARPVQLLVPVGVTQARRLQGG